MLPSAKSYLIRGGLLPRPASLVLIACFLGGVIGISIFSHLLHQFIPSHIVDCDHSHKELNGNDTGPHNDHAHGPEPDSTNDHVLSDATEDTPLLSRTNYDFKPRTNQRSESSITETLVAPDSPPVMDSESRRPSLQTRLTRQFTLLIGSAKSRCDEGGPCRGYTDPCGQECFKALSRSPTRALARLSVSGPPRSNLYGRQLTAALSHVDEESGGSGADSRAGNQRGRRSRRTSSVVTGADAVPSPRSTGLSPSGPRSSLGSATADQGHHHHVASNAFLSIGLQTSIAIALHKLPEGFITYATNHANPKLGFAVFMALFIHNITEGFAMALPLYLAVGNRLKAMVISAFLGGISQPLGAGIAALWLQTAQRHDMIPGEKVYGSMFAVTSGIMTTVALQLFAESMSLTHSRSLCIAFAFVGMGILGISNALTA
ncbi:MAG: hypothetical protein MMC23_009532 [Stictis urceolatum]|nr:hypothetical protein [Stictis urceolata]